jgi:uncharacterized membrane protein
MNSGAGSRSEAQQQADRIRVFREQLQDLERQRVLELTPEQRSRFDAWSEAKLRELAAHYDVDTTVSQKRVSWGMRIISTLGGLALCAAAVLFFVKFWGYLGTPAQVAIVMIAPLGALAGVEFAARRERTLYFAGVIALVSLALFILDLETLGRIFNITSTEKALLAWGVFSLLLAYRYGLRPMLVLALGLLLSYGSAAFTARLGYHWFDFWDRPEHFAILGLLAFATPFAARHKRNTDFDAVYRLSGSLAFFLAVLSLSEWGAHSYLPFDAKYVERTYEMAGLLTAAGAIWLGITRQWDGVVNTAAAFFALFLYCRLYHWWWDWMPKYLFFAILGAIAIALVLGFKRLRERLSDGSAA